MALFSTVGAYADDAWRAIKLYAKGYKKVPLKDTKGVLNNTNNFRWVKEGASETNIILPSGTTIFTSGYGDDMAKIVVKPDGRDIIATTFRMDHGVMFSLSQGKRTTTGARIKDGLQILINKTLKEAEKEAKKLTQKRLKFIDDFNAKYDRKVIIGDNGQKTKIVSDKKTGKTVSWWRRNEKGEVTQGQKTKIPLYDITHFKRGPMTATKEQDVFGQKTWTKWIDGHNVEQRTYNKHGADKELGDLSRMLLFL